MNLITGKIRKPLRVVVYGPEGVGKSTFAAQFPAPVFMDVEGGTAQLDVPRFERPASFDALLASLGTLLTEEHEFHTLVLDTADWAEKLAIEGLCARFKKAGIEEFGYGKGYTYLAEEWMHLVAVLNRLRDERGMHVVLVAHATIRKFEQPDEMGAYDRYELKCSRQVSPLVKEWADLLLFANFRTVVQESPSGKPKGIGGKERVVQTEHSSAWDAKNRCGLPAELPFKFEGIAHLFADTPAPAAAPAPAPAPTAPAATPEVRLQHQMKEAGIGAGALIAYLRDKGHITAGVDAIEKLPARLVERMTDPKNWARIVETLKPEDK